MLQRGELFGAFITNLGKYNEGELIGEWLYFPCSQEEFDVILDKIGCRDQGYEEYFVSDFDDINGIEVSYTFGEYATFEDMTEWCDEFEERFDNSCFLTLTEFCEVLEELYSGDIYQMDYDNLLIMPNCFTNEDIGYYLVDELGYFEDAVAVNDGIYNYLDFGQIGYDYTLETYGCFTNFGYVAVLQ